MFLMRFEEILFFSLVWLLIVSLILFTINYDYSTDLPILIIFCLSLLEIINAVVLDLLYLFQIAPSAPGIRADNPHSNKKIFSLRCK